jgi:hypothetical protein
MKKFLKIRKLQVLIVVEIVLLILTKSPKICREIDNHIIELQALVG